MVDKEATGTLPKVAILITIINQGVSGTAVLALQGGRRRDHLRARKVPLCPAALLGFRPRPMWQAGQDHRVCVPHSFEQVHGVGQEIKRVEKVWCGSELGPELLEA